MVLDFVSTKLGVGPASSFSLITEPCDPSHQAGRSVGERSSGTISEGQVPESVRDLGLTRFTLGDIHHQRIQSAAGIR